MLGLPGDFSPPHRFIRMVGPDPNVGELGTRKLPSLDGLGAMLVN
jgi:hypothetical protein